MAFNRNQTLDLLEVVQSPTGVAHILESANRLDYAPNEDATISNVDGVELKQFRRLKAPLAAAVARATSDPAIIRHAVLKDKRASVAIGLQWNPHMPQDLVEMILADQHHAIHTLAFKDRHCPLEDLLGSTEFRTERVKRILREADTRAVRNWATQALADSPYHGRYVHPIFSDEELPWKERVGLAEYLPNLDQRAAAVIAASSNVKTGEVDWSVGTWERILGMLPSEAGNRWSIRNHLMYSDRTPKSLFTAPLDWVHYILDNCRLTEWRLFAAQWGGPQALSDKTLTAKLSAAEHFSALTESGAATHLSTEAGAELLRKVLRDGEQSLAGSVAIELGASRGFLPGLDKSEVEDLLLLVVPGGNAYELTYSLNYAVGATGQPSAGYLRKLMEALVELANRGIAPQLARSINEWVKIPELLTCDAELRDLLLALVPADIKALDARETGLMRVVISAFEGRFPDADTATWDHFLSLWEIWDGTIGELLDTIEATL